MPRCPGHRGLTIERVNKLMSWVAETASAHTQKDIAKPHRWEMVGNLAACMACGRIKLAVGGAEVYECNPAGPNEARRVFHKVQRDEWLRRRRMQAEHEDVEPTASQGETGFTNEDNSGWRRDIAARVQAAANEHCAPLMWDMADAYGPVVCAACRWVAPLPRLQHSAVSGRLHEYVPPCGRRRDAEIARESLLAWVERNKGGQGCHDWVVGDWSVTCTRCGDFHSLRPIGDGGAPCQSAEQAKSRPSATSKLAKIRAAFTKLDTWEEWVARRNPHPSRATTVHPSPGAGRTATWKEPYANNKRPRHPTVEVTRDKGSLTCRRCQKTCKKQDPVAERKWWHTTACADEGATTRSEQP